jgi:outer membrane immunogenic protein
MKRLFLSTILSLLGGGYALAADFPQEPPPQPVYAPVVPIYNWTGFYVGINGGWGVGTAKWTGPFSSGSQSDSGGLIGGTLGANLQMGALVIGIEGDIDWSGIDTRGTGICSLTGACQAEQNWLGTVRGRIGYAWDCLLFYGTAGGIFGNTKTTFNDVTTSNVKTGWTAGAGVEWTFADNWTAKLEYLYANLGNVATTCSTSTCLLANGGSAIPLAIGLTDNLVRAGISYKFNFTPVAVAPPLRWSDQ